MDLTRIINMIVRIFLKRMINTGINKGIGMASNQRGPKKRARDMTPDERAQAQQASETTQRARQLTRLARRFGRF